MFIGSERELMFQSQNQANSFFICNQNWPQCRFDFTKEHLIIEEFVFKIDNLANIEIFNDYFAADKF